MDTYIAIDIGGTQIRVAVYPQSDNQPICEQRIPTLGEGSPLERMIGLIRDLWPAQGRVLAISAGAPGQVDPDAGIMVKAPNIAGWVDLNLRKELEDRFHVPAFINNDANIAALGEWRFGAARGHHNVVYVTVSTGIGGGVIMDDHLLLGQHGLATEIGHVVILPDGPLCGCGKRGHLEAISSGTGIANYFNEQVALGRPTQLKVDHRPTAKDIGQAAVAGDALALEAFQRAAHFLGIGMANYLHLFNPSIVVIGGGVSRVGEFFWQGMRAAMQAEVLVPMYLQGLKIVPAELGDNCGLLGALALAQTKLA